MRGGAEIADSAAVTGRGGGPELGAMPAVVPAAAESPPPVAAELGANLFNVHQPGNRSKRQTVVALTTPLARLRRVLHDNFGKSVSAWPDGILAEIQPNEGRHAGLREMCVNLYTARTFGCLTILIFTPK